MCHVVVVDREPHSGVGDQVARAGAAAGQAARGYVGAASRRQVHRVQCGAATVGLCQCHRNPSEGHRRAAARQERDASSTRLRGRPGHAQRGDRPSRRAVHRCWRPVGKGRHRQGVHDRSDANHIGGHRRDVDAALRIAEPQQIRGDLADALHAVLQHHVILITARASDAHHTADQKPGQPDRGPPAATNPGSRDARCLRDGVEQRLRDHVRDPALQPQRPHHRRVGQIHHGPPTAVEQVGGRT
ncbi:Uncharacterised protein [Mycobacterium tuberculosis]|nr:Uncharacterised protein [Mycobacterium tuberculosis]